MSVHLPPFVLWGSAHVWGIIASLIVPLGLAAWARRDPRGLRAIRISGLFASVLLVNYALYLWWWETHFPSLRKLLPFHLCDWSTIACVVAVWRRSQPAYDCAYFLGMIGGLVALVCPDIAFGFPSAPFWLFIVGHGGIVGTVLLLTFGLGFRPNRRSLVRAVQVLAVYLVSAGLVDLVLGTNYGYLRAKPTGASPLDGFGPWPWYVFGGLAIAAALLLLGYLPWSIVDRLKQPVEAPDQGIGDWPQEGRNGIGE